MAFPSFAWKYVPSSGVPTPPRCRPPRGGAAGGGLWRAFGCASLAEAGECGACAPGAGPAFSSGLAFRGCCLQMGPSGSHRRASGVSSRAPTVADVCGSISCRSGFTGDAFLRARVRLPAAHTARRRGRPVRPASEPPPSNGARLPAELKHITKRRKRNQQGCP
jgi:hypothetical protein